MSLFRPMTTVLSNPSLDIGFSKEYFSVNSRAISSYWACFTLIDPSHFAEKFVWIWFFILGYITYSKSSGSVLRLGVISYGGIFMFSEPLITIVEMNYHFLPHALLFLCLLINLCNPSRWWSLNHLHLEMFPILGLFSPYSSLNLWLLIILL